VVNVVDGGLRMRGLASVWVCMEIYIYTNIYIYVYIYIYM